MRESKMNVSTSNIWKSAAAAARQPVRTKEQSLHIGRTLRDLYFDEQTPKTEGAFAELLADLDEAEKDAAASSRNRLHRM